MGNWIIEKGIWQEVVENVVIHQKTVKHRAIDKLLDILIHIMTGEERMVTMNSGLRCDVGLQRAFGRETCAEQSLASTTLDRCDEETVRQMTKVLQDLLRKHGGSYKHNYKKSIQVLDVDMTGLPAGNRAEGSEKGYFAEKRGLRGRQLGRVLASNYGEIVYERLYSGRAHLESKLEELIEGAAAVLALNKTQRRHTLLRIDGAGGSDRFINWALATDFQILTKVHNWKRSHKLAASVVTWHPDLREAGREVGWVTEPHGYLRATRQLAIRRKNNKGQWQYNVLVTTLSPKSLRWLAQQPTPHPLPPGDSTMWALLYAYDRRGGGVETSIREGKQALGLNKRNKRKFIAQEMLVLLTQLAFNVLVWFRRALATIDSKWRTYGLLRLIRDFLNTRGLLDVGAPVHIERIAFSSNIPKVTQWKNTLQILFSSHELSFCLYEI
jgi:hypothetical protein